MDTKQLAAFYTRLWILPAFFAPHVPNQKSFQDLMNHMNHTIKYIPNLQYRRAVRAVSSCAGAITLHRTQVYYATRDTICFRRESWHLFSGETTTKKNFPGKKSTQKEESRVLSETFLGGKKTTIKKLFQKWTKTKTKINTFQYCPKDTVFLYIKETPIETSFR